MSFASFDSLILRRIADYIGTPYETTNLRATCRFARDTIAPPKKRMTPQAMWKWAMYRGYTDLAREAAARGARDLARYVNPRIATAEQCAELWNAKFASSSAFTQRGVLDLVIEPELVRVIGDIKLGNTAIIEQICSAPITDYSIARQIGKYASDEFVIRAVSHLELVNAPDVLSDGFGILDDIIGGTSKAHRVELSKALINKRVLLDDVNDITSLNELLLESGHVELHKLIVDKIQDHDLANLMFFATKSGSCEMCEYARKLQHGPFQIQNMIEGALHGGNIEVCELVKQWYRNLKMNGWVNCEPNSPDGLFDKIFEYVATWGTTAMFEYMRDWLYDDCETEDEYHDCIARYVGAAIRGAQWSGAYWITNLACKWDMEAEDTRDCHYRRDARICEVVAVSWQVLRAGNY